MTKISSSDVLMVVEELNNVRKEGDPAPSVSDVSKYLQEMEDIDYAGLRAALGKPLSDILVEWVEKDYIQRKWKQASFRYEITSKGGQYIKRQTG